MEEEQIIVAPAFESPDTYFLFRSTNEQVTIKIENGNWWANRVLTAEETNYINENIYDGRKNCA